MERLGKSLRAFGRALARVVVLVLLILMAALPVPAMPVVFFLQKWRRREVAAEIDRRR